MVHLLGYMREAAGGRDGVGGCRESGGICRSGEMNPLLSPTALCGRLLISSTCTTCASDKHEVGVCFNQRSYSVSMMVRL